MGINLNWLILGHGDIEGPAEFETQAPGRPSRAGTDPALLGQLIDEIANIYKAQNRPLSAERHGTLVAQLYDRLIVIADEAERRGATRYALSRLAEERR